MRHRWLFIVIPAAALMAAAFAAGAFSYLFARGPRLHRPIFAGGRVGVVEITGPIFSADEAIKDIESVRRRSDVKAVVLRIESPGGSVGASQEILEAVRMLGEAKPVVASLGSVAASGAYYIACGAERILANPGTITGSIGVRMEHVSVGDLLRWAMIQRETIKSGRFKDLGNIDRRMEPAERALVEDLLKELHGQFKESVAASRSLSMDAVDELADGRIYTGSRALELGLVDALGGFSEAVRLAAELGGVKGEPELAYPKRRGGLIRRLMEAAAASLPSVSELGFTYRRPVMVM